jgi:hypothetical protein
LNDKGETEYKRIYYEGRVGFGNNSKTTYQYNLDDLLSYIEEYKWDEDQWVKTGSEYSSYNDDDLLDVKIIEEIDQEGNIKKISMSILMMNLEKL